MSKSGFSVVDTPKSCNLLNIEEKMTTDKNRQGKLNAICVNCGGEIPPNTQVGVMIGQNGERLICHTSLDCSPAGNTHYGFWGEGKLISSFETVEQC